MQKPTLGENLEKICNYFNKNAASNALLDRERPRAAKNGTTRTGAQKAQTPTSTAYRKCTYENRTGTPQVEPRLPGLGKLGCNAACRSGMLRTAGPPPTNRRANGAPALPGIVNKRPAQATGHQREKARTPPFSIAGGRSAQPPIHRGKRSASRRTPNPPRKSPPKSHDQQHRLHAALTRSCKECRSVTPISIAQKNMKIEPERRRLSQGYPALACLAATLLAPAACSGQRTAEEVAPTTRPELATDAQRTPQPIVGMTFAESRSQSACDAQSKPQKLPGKKKRIEPRPEPAPQTPTKEP